MADRVFVQHGVWAVGSDGHQWILMHRRRRRAGSYWHPVSYVRSTKAILARCMDERGVPPTASSALLIGLPDTFDQWVLSQGDE